MISKVFGIQILDLCNVDNYMLKVYLINTPLLSKQRCFLWIKNSQTLPCPQKMDHESLDTWPMKVIWTFMISWILWNLIRGRVHPTWLSRWNQFYKFPFWGRLWRLSLRWPMCGFVLPFHTLHCSPRRQKICFLGGLWDLIFMYSQKVLQNIFPSEKLQI